MRCKWISKIIICLALILPFSGFSEQSSVTITLGEWPPFASESLPHGGLLPHLAREALAQENIAADFQFMSWEKAYQVNLQNQSNASVGWFKVPNREQEVLFSQPIAFSRLVFFHSTGMSFTWENMSDLKDYKIGVVAGYSYGSVFDNAASSGVLSILEYQSELEAFNGLIKGEIDLYPTDKEVGKYVLSSLPMAERDNIISDEHEILHDPLHLVVSKTNPDKQVLQKFNSGLNKLHKSGRYQEIVSNLSLVNTISRLQFYTEENPPMNYQDGDGEITGLSVKILEQLLQELDVEHERKKLTILPWARAYKDILHYENTVLFAMTKTEERANKFQWVGPFYRTNVVLYGRKDHEPLTIEDAKKKLVCAVREDVGAQTLVEFGFSEDLINLVSTPSQCALMIANGRVDLWSYSRDTAAWHFRTGEHPASDFKELLHLKESSRYFAFHKSVPTEVIQAFQSSLDYIQLSGQLQAIINHELN